MGAGRQDPQDLPRNRSWPNSLAVSRKAVSSSRFNAQLLELASGNLGSLEFHAFNSAKFDVFLAIDAIRCPCMGDFRAMLDVTGPKFGHILVDRIVPGSSPGVEFFLLVAGLHEMMISARKYICFS